MTWRVPTGARWSPLPDLSDPSVSGTRCLTRENGVHVWQAALDVSPAQFDTLHAHLTPEEVARAERYRFTAPSRRFVAARGLLREILGAYLDVVPAQLRFRQNAWGKPLLAEPRDALQFNVAHTGDLLLVAVTADRAVGIDVETVRPVRNLDRLIARVFSPTERAAFRALPRWQRLEAFFATWTRKEAYMKARGLGFGLSLGAFDVTVALGAPPRVLADRQISEAGYDWILYDIPVASTHKASFGVCSS
jgi:4'-phosphopantetheinyl transferase